MFWTGPGNVRIFSLFQALPLTNWTPGRGYRIFWRMHQQCAKQTIKSTYHWLETFEVLFWSPNSFISDSEHCKRRQNATRKYAYGECISSKRATCRSVDKLTCQLWPFLWIRQNICYQIHRISSSESKSFIAIPTSKLENTAVTFCDNSNSFKRRASAGE